MLDAYLASLNDFYEFDLPIFNTEQYFKRNMFINMAPHFDIIIQLGTSDENV